MLLAGKVHERKYGAWQQRSTVQLECQKGRTAQDQKWIKHERKKDVRRSDMSSYMSYVWHGVFGALWALQRTPKNMSHLASCY